MNFITKKNALFILISIVVICVLLAIPIGFEGALQFKDAEKCKVLVESVDNSSLIDTGLIRTCQQICNVRFLNGRFRGQTSIGWKRSGLGCKYIFYNNKQEIEIELSLKSSMQRLPVFLKTLYQTGSSNEQIMFTSEEVVI